MGAHLRELGERVLQRAGPEESRIFDAQILMAQDEDFLASVETLIRNNQLSAETAYEFKALEREAHAMGFDAVASGPLVRSSYHADEAAAQATEARAA